MQINKITLTPVNAAGATLEDGWEIGCGKANNTSGATVTRDTSCNNRSGDTYANMYNDGLTITVNSENGGRYLVRTLANWISANAAFDISVNGFPQLTAASAGNGSTTIKTWPVILGEINLAKGTNKIYFKPSGVDMNIYLYSVYMEYVSEQSTKSGMLISGAEGTGLRVEGSSVVVTDTVTFPVTVEENGLYNIKMHFINHDGYNSG